MRRRTFVATGLAATATVSLARAQTPPATPAPAPATTTPAAAPLALRPIEPENALEYAFVQALTSEGMRSIFRRYLLETHVALALAGPGADAAPREVEVHAGERVFDAVAIFTSATRINTVLGEDAPRIIINGRAALERVRDKNVVINFHLIPMLTLEPEDVARYLDTPGESSAGPSQ